MNDKSILLQLDEQGQPAPRIDLEGADGQTRGEERYDVIGEIARGGVGVVHKGRDNDLGRDVALKVLRDEHLAKPELVQRFVEEAQIGGQLQHPGIVPVYELGLRTDQRPFFAMKLVKGETMAKKLARRSDPSDGRRALLAVFREVCRTMAYAHARGVIHRDLKPSNVMIGNFGEVQVVDWGFAKVLARGGVADERLAKKAARDVTMISTVRSSEGSDSVAGSVMGTPAYMSPEQAMGRVEDLDERSDIFSLGAILCEILTGQPPYVGNSADRFTAARRVRLDDALARLDACDADARLVDLARRCLEPLPKDRPQSAQVLGDEVAASLVAAESRAHRAQMRAVKAKGRADEQRRARRQSAIVGGSIVAITLIAIGAWLWVDAQRTERDAERTRAIDAALQDVTRLSVVHDWEGTLAAVRRATELGADDDVLAQVKRRAEAEKEQARLEAEDDAFAAELEEIKGALGEFGDGPASQARALDARYAAAFAARFQTLGEAHGRLRTSRHRDAFLSNALLWLYLREQVGTVPGRPTRAEVRNLVIALSRDPELLQDITLHGDLPRLLARVRSGVHEIPSELAMTAATRLTETGHAQDALEFLQPYLDRDPGDFWLHYAAHFAATAVRDSVRALEHGTAAVALRPESALAWRKLGLAHLIAGQSEHAVRALRRSLEINPTGSEARSNLAIALMRTGRTEDAEREIQSVLESRRHTKALDIFAQILRAKGDLAGATRAVEEALTLDPNHPVVHAHLGDLRRLQGDATGALSALEQAATLAPDVLHYRVEIAKVYAFQMNAPKRAKPILETVIEKEPDNGLAHTFLGYVHHQLGAFEEAIAAQEAGLELFDGDPTDRFRASVLYNIACSCVRAGEPHHARALDAMRAHIDIVAHYIEADAAYVVRTMAHAETDEDLSDVRDSDDVSPEWTQLWKDVAALEAKATAAR